MTHSPTTRALAAVLLGAAAFASAPAHAQTNLAELSFEYIPSTGFQEGRAADLGVELETYQMGAGFLAPARLNEATAMLFGAHYALFVPLAEAPVVAPNAPDTLHTLQLQWLLVNDLNDQWRLLVFGAPGISSAFTNVDEQAFIFQGFLQAAVRLDPQLGFGFGLGVSFLLGRLLPLPALSLEWRPIPRLRVDVHLPGSSSAAYMIGDNRLEIGAKLRVQGRQFQVGNEVLDTSGYTQVDAGGHVGVRLFAELWVEVYGGVTLLRNLELFDREGADLLSSTLDPAFVGQASLVFRLPRRGPPPAAETPEPEDGPD